MCKNAWNVVQRSKVRPSALLSVFTYLLRDREGMLKDLLLEFLIQPLNYVQSTFLTEDI